MIKKLKNAFWNIVGYYWDLTRAFNSKAGRPMTPNEIALVKDVFGDTIDYSRVKVCKMLCSGKGTAARAFNDHIFIPSSWDKKGDMSQPCENNIQDVLRRAVFLHEMTHIWQGQTNGLQLIKSITTGLLGSLGKDVYKYNMRDDKKFNDLGIEQQAQLVEDYVRTKEMIAFYGSDNKIEINDVDAKEIVNLTAKKIRTQFPFVKG